MVQLGMEQVEWTHKETLLAAVARMRESPPSGGFPDYTSPGQLPWWDGTGGCLANLGFVVVWNNRSKWGPTGRRGLSL